MSRPFQLAYLLLIWVFVLGVASQAYSAGLAIFGTGSALAMHSSVGWLLALVAILLPVLALLGRFPRSVAVMTFVVLALMFVQVSLVTFVATFRQPALTALHPANALVLFAVALTVGYRATRWALGGRADRIAREASGVGQPVRA
jgi:hypothetical protein